jgi:glycosyltransferase involved in cell wall biosynthesis
MDPEFDPEFYRTRYPDLAELDDPARLWRHFASHGRAEGRLPNEAAAIRQLEAELGPLPSGFRPSVYRTMHADLRAAIKSDWEAAEHYLRYGRAEKRKYQRFDADLYRSLYFSEKILTDYELELDYREHGTAAGRIGSWAEYIEREGISSGAWLDRLKTDEFELLNWDWAGPTPTKLDAVRKFLAGGVERLAPIAFDAAFDPAFYRETHPELAGQSDAALYRRWLFTGLGKDEAGSPEERMRQLGLRLRDYPEAFDWRAYLEAHPKLPKDRWSALADVVRVHPAPKPKAGETATAPALRPSRVDEVLSLAVREDGAAFLSALGEHVRGRDDRAAVAAFERARALGDRSFPTTHHLADALFRLKRWREALQLFQEGARFPEAEVWTYVNGAKAAMKLGAFRAAEQLLAAGLGSVNGEPAWRDAVGDLAEAMFAARTAKARKLYAFPDGRDRADAAIARIVQQVGDLWERLDPIGAPLPASAEGRVVVLASYDLKVCTHYRIEQKAELFELAGRKVEFFSLDEWKEFVSALPGAAAAIVFRLPAWPSVTRAMRTARKMGVPLYYEIDDLIFDSKEYPDTWESYGGLLSREDYEGLLYGVPLFRAAVQMADYGIVSTTPLGRAVAPLVRTGRWFWLPNGLDSRNEDWLESPPHRMRRDPSIVIAYASGTKAHNSDFNELAGPALVRLLKARPDVKLLLVGYLALDPAFDEVRDQIVRFDYVPGSEAWWSMLADADISFAVLKPTWATDSKSEIKWLEAAVFGIPSVVSETAMYSEVLEDGEDALIVRTPEEWFEALERLVDDPDLRARIGSRARESAAERYSLQANAARLEALLEPALEQRLPRKPAPRTKPRILLANVWFPPQTVGGATRVVRNNLDAWLDGPEAAEFDFAVVTTDNGVAPPNRLRVDEYRGVPVLRISTPMQVNMDWRPENEEVGERFADFLASWKPDLVHFHAVQRLTASAVEACREAGVPYVVTTHDAWWLSDHHFLVDEQGRVRQPCEDFPRDPPRGVTVAQSIDRRRVLATALHGAEAVLGVSESFAAMHRACGFERAIAIPNGVPPAPAVARTPSGSGRVRLAHVGNVSKHKGYHLVQAALKGADLRNLELTVIDHARTGGSAEHQLWGGTPVRLVGKLPQEQVHQLYAETDVLLAPSIWPESFGLVAREALQAGCWVIASDRGAMGEDVTPGVNGFVVDVSTVEGLLEVLRTIDSDPATYLQSPSFKPELRTAADQARDVAQLYRRILSENDGSRLAG